MKFKKAIDQYEHMITDRVHEKIGNWLLKREDEVRSFSYKRHVLENAYEMFIVRKMRTELLASAAICLFVALVFDNSIIRWVCFLAFFTVNFCSAMIIAKKHMIEGEEYAKAYVDKRLGKGQYHKIIGILHSRKFDKLFHAKYVREKKN